MLDCPFKETISRERWVSKDHTLDLKCQPRVFFSFFKSSKKFATTFRASYFNVKHITHLVEDLAHCDKKAFFDQDIFLVLPSKNSSITRQIEKFLVIIEKVILVAKKFSRPFPAIQLEHLLGLVSMNELINISKFFACVGLVCLE